MSTTPIDYDALAAQHGGSTDYDALAKQSGGWEVASEKPAPPTWEVASEQPAPKSVPVFDSKGALGDVPQTSIGNAVKGGLKIAVPVVAADGSKGYIPHDRISDYLKVKGNKIDFSAPEAQTVLESMRNVGLASVDRPPMPKAPQPDMKPSYLGVAVQNSPSNADPENPANASPELLNQMDPETRAQTESTLRDTAIAMLPAMGAAKAAEAYGPAILEHLRAPGAILKFPYGRAVEYYMAAKLGLGKQHIKDVAAILAK
jgi:hypothetical protein